MIVRWWRARKAPHEEWQLVALRPSGSWTPLALVFNKDSDEKRYWAATMCITSGGSGSTWMGSDLLTKHQRRGEAFRAAEVMCGIQDRVRRVTWPEVWVRGWSYPPRATSHRQRALAKLQGADLRAFQDATSKLLASIRLARRSADLEETKRMLKCVVGDLARGDLVSADGRLENAVYDETTTNAVNALSSARAALGAYKTARTALKRQPCSPHRA